MRYNTINNIIDDLLLQMRRNNITESESYNRKQLEIWIVQYRNAFVNKMVAEGFKVPSNYYQSFVADLNQVDDLMVGAVPIVIKRSNQIIPRTCTGSSGGITLSSFDMFGNEIQIMSKRRSKLNRSRRHFNASRPTAYIDDARRYCIDNAAMIDSVSISGIFIHPSEVPGFDPEKDQFPIEPADLPEIKRLIFTNELKFNIVPDTKNDGRDGMTIASK